MNSHCTFGIFDRWQVFSQFFLLTCKTQSCVAQNFLCRLARDRSLCSSLGAYIHVVEEPMHHPQNVDHRRLQALARTIALLIENGGASPSGPLIMVRKQLLFGDETERLSAVILATQLLSKLQDLADKKALFSLLLESVPRSLSDASSLHFLSATCLCCHWLSDHLMRTILEDRVYGEVGKHAFYLKARNSLVADLGVELPNISADVYATLGVTWICFNHKLLGIEQSPLDFVVMVPRGIEAICACSDLSERLGDYEDIPRPVIAADEIQDNNELLRVFVALKLGASLIVQILNVFAAMHTAHIADLDDTTRAQLIEKILEWDQLEASRDAIGTVLQRRQISLREATPYPLFSSDALQLVLLTLSNAHESSLTPERIVLERFLLSSLNDRLMLELPLGKDGLRKRKCDVQRPSALSYDCTLHPLFISSLLSRVSMEVRFLRRLRIQQAEASARGEQWESATLCARFETVLESVLHIFRLLQRSSLENLAIALRSSQLMTERELYIFFREIVILSVHPVVGASAVNTFRGFAQLLGLQPQSSESELWLECLETVYETPEGRLGSEFLNWPFSGRPISYLTVARNKPGYTDRYRLASLLCSMPVDSRIREVGGWVRRSLHEIIHFPGPHRRKEKCLLPPFDDSFAVVFAEAAISGMGTLSDRNQMRAFVLRMRVLDGISRLLLLHFNQGTSYCVRGYHCLAKAMQRTKQIVRHVMDREKDQTDLKQEVTLVLSSTNLAVSSVLELATSVQKQDSKSRRLTESMAVFKLVPGLIHAARTLQDLLITKSAKMKILLTSQSTCPRIDEDESLRPGCGVRSSANVWGPQDWPARISEVCSTLVDESEETALSTGIDRRPESSGNAKAFFARVPQTLNDEFEEESTEDAMMAGSGMS
uniref:Uncharacterized protein n=2 Tax=Compsopogon caeruleus TaxID=31354 RepID=A0A7S1XFS9_9RHOD|mmetsp:Transcript_4860/g.9822  ORF Transcript_4860/g.9822 Transcript_4860/m.9822 type:complete len:890 (+) Transcript_4860:1066-3735(+)